MSNKVNVSVSQAADQAQFPLAPPALMPPTCQFHPREVHIGQQCVPQGSDLARPDTAIGPAQGEGGVPLLSITECKGGGR